MPRVKSAASQLRSIVTSLEAHHDSIRSRHHTLPAGSKTVFVDESHASMSFRDSLCGPAST